MKEKQLSIKASILWNSWGSIFYLGCQWLITVLVVRLTNVETAGYLTLAISVNNVLYSVAVYGMRNFQVSDTKAAYTNGTYIFSRLLTCLISFVACVIFILLMSYDSQQKWCIFIYFIYKTSEAVFDVYAGIFQKEWRMDFIGKSLTMRGIVSIGSFVVMTLLTGNLLAAIAVMAVLTMCCVIVYDLRIARQLTNAELEWNLLAVFQLLKECFPLVIYTFLSSVIGTIPRLFMERLIGGYKLGIYGSVATPTLIVQMAATYIFNPLVTLFAEHFNNHNKLGFFQILKKCIIGLCAISIIAVVGGKIFGHLGLLILYGEEVASYEYLLIPLIVCTILTAFSWLLCGVLTAVREFKGLMAANFAAVAASAVASFLCIPIWDMQGATVALGFATLVEIIILSVYLVKKTKKQFKEV